jgi:hypothetical protein
MTDILTPVFMTSSSGQLSGKNSGSEHKRKRPPASKRQWDFIRVEEERIQLTGNQYIFEINLRFNNNLRSRCVIK